MSEEKLPVEETPPPEEPPAPPALPPQPRRKRFVPKYEIDGVHKVILGEETQMNIEMSIGTHINAQFPWKFVEKSKIMDTIETLGEGSEFYFIKDQLGAYDASEVLMGYIADESKDVDEFYVCVTSEARDHCKEQSDRYIKRQQRKLKKAVEKKPGIWNSLGSEIEIIELIPINQRSLIELEIKTKFPTEYQPTKFQVRDTNASRDGYVELTPYRQKFNIVLRRRIDTATQVTPPKFEREAQTDLRYPQNAWTQSIADAIGTYTDEEGGGDTKQDDVDDLEDSSVDSEEDRQPSMDEVGLAPYKEAMRKLRRPSYIKKMNKFAETNRNEFDSVIELNTVMDIYANDYPNLVTTKTTSIYDTMTFHDYVCFTDVRAKNKYVSSAAFHPMWSGIVALAYSDGSPNILKNVSGRPDPIQRAVYGLNPVMIWSHIDSLLPKLYLESPREVKFLSFCPFDENILVGGCVNGQVILWDLKNKLENVEKIEVLTETREKYRIAMNSHMTWMKNVHDSAVVPATALSNLMTSHYGPITCIKWLSPNFVITSTGMVKREEPGKRSLEFFTGSEDGTILIWNLSTENVMLFEGKKVKKSKRVLRRPSGLMTDFSPYKVLDRYLQPCFKIILGIAGEHQILAVQSFAMNSPKLKYNYTPNKFAGSGRKYFSCEVLPETDDAVSKVLYCGSMHGQLSRLSYEGHEFNTGEMVNSEYCNFKFSCYIHDGAITTTQKNPFLNHLTLTVGGKIFAIWCDTYEARPVIWKKRPHRLTSASWSLYKPSIIFLATAEGTVETWDLLIRSDLPITIQTMSGTTLTSVDLHTLPLSKNIIAVGDANGSYKMFLDPPIFMLQNPSYVGRMENTIMNELKVMKSFMAWQAEWMKQNPEILLEIKRKEGVVLAEKEEERQRLREEEEKRLEEEAEARRQEKMRVVGPEERWKKIINRLIERTIAVKKRINRAELIEQEKPLRELETQRLEKEKRMLEIMKNQKTIFNDTVAILFPEALKKKEKEKKSYFTDDKELTKKSFLKEYEAIKDTAKNTVSENPYVAEFSWEATLAEGKERRQALTGPEVIIKLHKTRLELEGPESQTPKVMPIRPLAETLAEDEDEHHATETEPGMTQL